MVIGNLIQIFFQPDENYLNFFLYLCLQITSQIVLEYSVCFCIRFLKICQKGVRKMHAKDYYWYMFVCFLSCLFVLLPHL